MSKSSQVRCEHCDELITDSSHATVAGEDGTQSYHYWCLRELREDAYMSNKSRKKTKPRNKYLSNSKRSVYCQICQKPVETKDELAVVGKWFAHYAYHFECFKERQRQKFEYQLQTSKSVRIDLSTINNKAHTWFGIILFSVIWVPTIVILLSPEFEDSLLELCRTTRNRNMCESDHPFVWLATFLIYSLFTVPLLQRFLSWFKYERHLDK